VRGKGSRLARRVVIFIGLLLAVIIYQTLVADIITVGTARPDLIIVLIVWLTLTRNLMWGVTFAFAAGILEDSHYPHFLGLGALLKVGAAVGIHFISHRVRTEGLFVRIIMVIGVVVAHDILYFLVVYAFDPKLELMALLNTIIPSALYTSIFAAFVLYLSEKRLSVTFES